MLLWFVGFGDVWAPDMDFTAKLEAEFQKTLAASALPAKPVASAAGIYTCPPQRVYKSGDIYTRYRPVVQKCAQR
jgi:hypothetical protein